MVKLEIPSTTLFAQPNIPSQKANRYYVRCVRFNSIIRKEYY